jgi:hypothetical protein
MQNTIGGGRLPKEIFILIYNLLPDDVATLLLSLVSHAQKKLSEDNKIWAQRLKEDFPKYNDRSLPKTIPDGYYRKIYNAIANKYFVAREIPARNELIGKYGYTKKEVYLQKKLSGFKTYEKLLSTSPLDINSYVKRIAEDLSQFHRKHIDFHRKDIDFKGCLFKTDLFNKVDPKYFLGPGEFTKSHPMTFLFLTGNCNLEPLQAFARMRAANVTTLVALEHRLLPDLFHFDYNFPAGNSFAKTLDLTNFTNDLFGIQLSYFFIIMLRKYCIPFEKALSLVSILDAGHLNKFKSMTNLDEEHEFYINESEDFWLKNKTLCALEFLGYGVDTVYQVLDNRDFENWFRDQEDAANFIAFAKTKGGFANAVTELKGFNYAQFYGMVTLKLQREDALKLNDHLLRRINREGTFNLKTIPILSTAQWKVWGTLEEYGLTFQQLQDEKFAKSFFPNGVWKRNTKIYTLRHLAKCHYGKKITDDLLSKMAKLDDTKAQAILCYDVNVDIDDVIAYDDKTFKEKEQQWKEKQEKEKQIYELKEQLEKIVNSMFYSDHHNSAVIAEMHALVHKFTTSQITITQAQIIAKNCLAQNGKVGFFKDAAPTAEVENFLRIIAAIKVDELPSISQASAALKDFEAKVNNNTAPTISSSSSSTM